MTTYEPHPLASLVPVASQSERDALAADIAAHGLIEPVVLYDGQILDGRHRYEACRKVGVECRFREYGGSDPAAFVVSANLARRHLTKSQRAMVAGRLMDTPPHRPKKGTNSSPYTSKANAAEATNVGRTAVTAARKVIDKAAPAVAAAVDAGEVAVSDAAAVADESHDVQERALSAPKGTLRSRVKVVKREIAREKAAAAPVQADPRLHCCPVAELAQHVPQGGVDAVVTDPPYVAASLPVYRELAEFAVHALRPGGALLCFAGHPHLPQIFEYMELGGGEALRYRWAIAYYQPSARQQVHSARATVVWKPVLAFTRAGGQPEGYSTDWIDSGPYSPSDKQRHHWGQSPGGLEALIREWVKQPGLICDPFCGTGSTLVAALRLGHRVVGADIDETNVRLTKEALA